MAINKKGMFFSYLEIALTNLSEKDAKKLWHDVLRELQLSDHLKSLNISPEKLPVGDVDLLINWVQELSIPEIFSSDIWNRVITAAGGSITTIGVNEDEPKNEGAKPIGKLIKATFTQGPKLLFSKFYKMFIFLCFVAAVLYSLVLLTDAGGIVHNVINVMFHIVGLYTIFLFIYLSIGLFPFLVIFEVSRVYLKKPLFSKLLNATRLFLFLLLILSPATFFIFSAAFVIKLYVFDTAIGIILGGLSSLKNYYKPKSQYRVS